MDMQNGRLFEIIYILLDKKLVTAGELAEHLEVSVRTIYRDIENLSAAGIPVYMNKGRGGGISLLPEFVLNKAVLSDREKDDILTSLRALGEVTPALPNQTLKKLAGLFGKSDNNWIEVEFGAWSDGERENELFQVIKSAILSKNVIDFVYVSAKGQELTRKVEPLKLVYKSGSWYLYGYCRKREDVRFFKCKRIRDLKVTTETFERKPPERIFTEENHEPMMKMVHLKLRIEKCAAYRIYDEFEIYEQQGDGSFLAETDMPDNEWLLNYILGFGKSCRVLEPLEVRRRVKKELEQMLCNYADAMQEKEKDKE